jgi:ubiquinone biosynthesis protein COQ9
MAHSSIALPSGGNNVFSFFRRKKEKAIQDRIREAEIERIKHDIALKIVSTSKKVDRATDKIQSFNTLVESDVTARIFFATGGDRRSQ